MASPVFQLHAGCALAVPLLEMCPMRMNAQWRPQCFSCVCQRAGEHSAQWRLHCSLSQWRQVLSVVVFWELKLS